MVLVILRTYRRAYAGLPRTIWALSSLMLVSSCGTMVVPFLTIYLSKVQGYPAHSAVQFLAVYGLGGIAGAFLGGALSRRLGAVRVMLASWVLRAPAYVTIPWCTTPAGLVANLFLLSMFAEMCRPALAIATAENSPPDAMARSFALNRLAGNLGFSIGSAAGGFLASFGLWAWLFWINFASALLSALAAWWFFRGGQPAAGDARPERLPGEGSPWRDHGFLAFLGLQLVSGLVFFQMMSTYPVYLSEQYRLREDQIGMMFVINTLLIVLLEMVITDKLRRWPPIHLVSVGTGLVCVGFGATLFGEGYAFAAALAVVWTMGEMLCAPFSVTYAAQRSVGRNREAYLGLNSVSLALAVVGAPLLGGLLYQLDPRLLWWCCLSLAGLLPAGFWLLSRSEPPGAARQEA